MNIVVIVTYLLTADNIAFYTRNKRICTNQYCVQYLLEANP